MGRLTSHCKALFRPAHRQHRPHLSDPRIPANPAQQTRNTSVLKNRHTEPLRGHGKKFRPTELLAHRTSHARATRATRAASGGKEPGTRRTHHEPEAPLQVDIPDAAVPLEEPLHVLLPGGGVQPPDEDAAAAHGWGREARCGRRRQPRLRPRPVTQHGPAPRNRPPPAAGLAPKAAQ